MSQERINKVTAVVIRRGQAGVEVLAFDHPLPEGGVMVQVPAGTIEADEPPDAAALRELLEETGIRGKIVGLAGVWEEGWEGEKRHRWVYVLQAPEGVTDEWPFTCDCGASILCYWLPIQEAELVSPQQPWLEVAKVWLQANR